MPYVGDSKRAMDEYTSEIFMGGRNTLVIHNTCEDSLLAAPIILDLVLLAELITRIEMKKVGCTEDFSHHLIMQRNILLPRLIYNASCDFPITLHNSKPIHSNGSPLPHACGSYSSPQDGEPAFHGFHPIAVLLSYLTKAPLVPQGTPVINALAKQRAMLENVMRACVGLAPESNMMMEFK